MTINETWPADMNRAEDRQALSRALAARGIEARASHLGGNIQALEIVLVPDDGREGLSILVTGMDAPCEVGLSGFRTISGRLIDCGQAEPLRPRTLELAAEAVATYWIDREAFIRGFRAGSYDLD